MRISIYKKEETRDVPDGISQYAVARMENIPYGYQPEMIGSDVMQSNREIHIFQEEFICERKSPFDANYYKGEDGFRCVGETSAGDRKYLKTINFIIDDDFLEKCFVSGKRTINDLISKNGNLNSSLKESKVEISRIKNLTFFSMIKEWIIWKKPSRTTRAQR